MVDRTYVGRTKYSYKDLLKRELPEDVDPQHKEVREEFRCLNKIMLLEAAFECLIIMFCTYYFQHNLSEKQFKEAVKFPRDQFYRLPLWKQDQLFKSARLGHTGASENPYRLRIESPENHNQ